MATNNASNYKPTQYSSLVGDSNGQITSVAPSATTGVPFISQGASANPAFGTAVVAGGGTGITSATAYTPLCGGTTATGALQSVASVGTANQVLTSNGAGALPSFQDPPAVVAFYATRSSDISNVTGDGTQYVVVFNNAPINPGTAINTATGVFTAPDTGTYFMSGAVLIKGLLATHSYTLIYIRNATSGTSIFLGGEKHAYNNADVNGSTQVQFSSIISLTASDQVELRIVVSGGTKVVDIQGQGNPYCTYWSILKL